MIDGNGLHVDGVRHPLVGGQFEFWRNNPIFWRRILQSMKELGLTIVSTFVCWEYHELAVGDFDFIGMTTSSRDLAGFLDLCSQERMDVLIRIGPYIDAEWPSRGLPPDLDGLERLNGHFEARTRQYVEALAPVIVPRLATHGGNIIAIALDCEAYFPRVIPGRGPSIDGGANHAYDSDLVVALYRDWLHERYSSDEHLHEAWGRRDVSRPTAGEPDYETASLVEALDSLTFSSEMVVRSTCHLRAMCTRVGLTGVPFYTTNKKLMFFIDWRSMEEQSIDSLGFALSMPSMWPGAQKLVASWNFRIVRARNKLCWASEFLAGLPEAKVETLGIATDTNTKMTNLLGCALGMRGLIYYMCVDRDDTILSPISAIGQIRPRGQAYAEMIRIHGMLRSDRHIADVGLLWSMDHHRCRVTEELSNWRGLAQLTGEFAEPKELTSWWECFARLHAADVDFDIAPIDQDIAGFRSLIYAGPEFARREEVERLAKWVDGGGRLLAVTALPRCDMNGIPFDDLTRNLIGHHRVTARSWGGWERELYSLEAWRGARAALPGLWTFAYADEEGVTIFAANVAGHHLHGRLALGVDVFQIVAGAKAIDLVSGEEWVLGSADFWPADPPLLAPDEVRAIRIDCPRAATTLFGDQMTPVHTKEIVHEG